MTSLPATLNIQPHPRILSVLKDMEFSAVQALAELCDNSFDEFRAYAEAEPSVADTLLIKLSIPAKNEDPQTAEVHVVDNGRGMSLERLNNAMRAGWSGNDPFNQLGLFGLGFNVATARLGTVCKVLTTRDGDAAWHGVEINLFQLRSQAEFDVPVINEPKNDPSQHGTRIVVSSLNPAVFNQLVRRKPIREDLGDIYAPILTGQPFKLYVNSTAVSPRRHCAWDASRSVTFGSGKSAEEISARLDFEKHLRDQSVCADCHRWQDEARTECTDCGSTNIAVRERVIRGWIGVQRYLDTSDYGIDFVRNGRKILSKDKSLFYWTSPDGTELQEYPVELPHLGGRIIGEVHVDYAKPSWQKDAFENEAELVVVRDALRGDDGPLRPQYRRKHGYAGYAPGPLARIHRAYSVVKPGKRYLIPGNGASAIHDKAREWGRRFHEGDSAHFSDEKWWSAVEFHEAAAEERRQVPKDDRPSTMTTAQDLLNEGTMDEETVESIFGPLPTEPQPGPKSAPEEDDGDEPDEEAEEQEPEKDSPETFIDRVDRYLREGQQVPELDGDVTVPGSTRYVNVAVYLVGEPVLDADNQRVPALARFDRSDLNIFVDQHHPLFVQYDLDYMAVVLAEVAEVFRVTLDSEAPLAEIIWRIADSKLSDRNRQVDTLNREAASLLDRIRERLSELTALNSETAAAAWEALEAVELQMAETAAAAAIGRPLSPGDAQILLYVPALALPRIVEANPVAWLDGKLFRVPWASFSTDNQRGRWLSVAQIAGLLYDLGALVERPIPMKGDALRRAALSLPLLEAQLVYDVDDD